MNREIVLKVVSSAQSSLKQLLFLLMASLFLTGCVSQTSIKDSPNAEPIVKKGPDLNEAAEQRLNLGLRYLQAGHIERAKHNLDKAYKHAPNKASVHIGLAYYYEQVKDSKLASEHYRTALKIDSKNGDYLNLYGSFLCGQKDYKNANKNFMKAVKQPHYANAAATYENAGICAKRSGDLKRAEGYFDRALDHNPKISTSLLEKAEILFSQKRLFKARTFLKRHFAVTSSSPQALWLGIQIEKVMGDTDALASYGLKLMGMFPESDEADLYRASKNL